MCVHVCMHACVLYVHVCRMCVYRCVCMCMCVCVGVCVCMWVWNLMIPDLKGVLRVGVMSCTCLSIGVGLVSI